jgi:hypothetical protein
VQTQREGGSARALCRHRTPCPGPAHLPHDHSSLCHVAILRASEWGKAKGRSPVGSPDPMREAARSQGVVPGPPVVAGYYSSSTKVTSTLTL